MCDEQVTILRPSHLRAVHMLDHQPEKIVVPREDQSPQVSIWVKKMFITVLIGEVV